MKEFKARSRLLEREGKMPLPKHLIFEPTVVCNLNCTMCERHVSAGALKKKELEFEEIRKFINNLPPSIESVYISGGEPTLRPDLIDIIKCFRKRGMVVNFQSNGTLVDRVLEASRIKGVFPSFSLDGPRDVHNKIRGKSFVFDRNMKIFHALREELHKGLIITSIICEDNLHVLKEMIGLLKEEDLVPDLIIFELARWITKEMVEDTIRLLGVNEEDLPPHLKDRETPSFSYEDFSKLLTELNETLQKNKFNYLFVPKNLLERSKEFYYRSYRDSHELFCEHLEVLRIGSEGNVTPCFNIRNSLGNVTRDSIETIWNSREFRDYRVNLIENNLTPLCESCFRCLDIHTYKEPGLLDGAKGVAKRVLRFPRMMMHRK